MERNWLPGQNDSVFTLGKPGSPQYGGFVARVQRAGMPEKWVACEYVSRANTHARVGVSETLEVAQSALTGDFLCEVFLSLDKPGNCPFPGSVVRHKVYRGERLRTVLCGEHSKLFEGWARTPLQDYRKRYGLIPDQAIYGGRVSPVPDIACFVDSAKNAETYMERNMWISMHRAARAHADWRHWLGHYAAYPLPVNRPELQDVEGRWKRAKEHAEGMYRVYAREDHDQEDAVLPDYFLHSIACKAAEILRSRKR
jgi:hypothetical protein